MIHTTPTKALLATTLHPLVVQLSGSLAHGARLIDDVLHQEPTPQKMATFEGELHTLLREVGRRIMAWVLNSNSRSRPAKPIRPMSAGVSTGNMTLQSSVLEPHARSEERHPGRPADSGLCPHAAPPWREPEPFVSDWTKRVSRDVD